MPSDSELLRQFAENRDEGALAEIVRRHADLVYSVALRVAHSDAMAQDVTQAVFTKLAGRASMLSRYDTIIGWLHTAARHAAIDAIRGEERRRAREQEAILMQHNAAIAEINWESIGPLLDEAVDQLREDDRKAVLLRFFKNHSHQEIGAALNLSEDTARKRVDRALEKLRRYFASHGVTASSAILATAMSANSVQAAPVGLAEKVTVRSLPGVGGTGWGALLIIALMNNKSKSALALAALMTLLLAVKFTWPETATSMPATGAPRSPANLPLPKPLILSVENPRASVQSPTISRAPMQPAADPGPSSPAAQPDSPRRQIDTAMDDFANLLEAGNYYQAANTYIQISPDMTGEQVVDSLRNNPGFAAMIQMFTASTRAARLEAPTYNAAGDIATYRLDPPVEGKTVVRWKKINDAWYVDGYE